MNALNVADFFLERAKESRQKMSRIRLIKLSYLSYCWYLVLFRSRLFEESPLAWENGPVVASVWYALKALEQETVSFSLSKNTPVINERVTKFLNRMWETHWQKTDDELCAMTSCEHSPWAQTVLSEGFTAISDADIVRFYTDAVSRMADAAA